MNTNTSSSLEATFEARKHPIGSSPDSLRSKSSIPIWVSAKVLQGQYAEGLPEDSRQGGAVARETRAQFSIRQGREAA
jgi:hypothetical protein